MQLAVPPSYFSRVPKSLIDPVLYPRSLEKFFRTRKQSPLYIVLCFDVFYAIAAKHVWPGVPAGSLPGSTVWDWYSWLYGHRALLAQYVLSIRKLLGVLMERQAIKLADKIFIESNLLIKRFEQFHPGVRRKVSVFRTPLDIARFCPSRSRREEARKELGIPADTKMIVAVGRLQWNKNVATLVRAASLLHAKNWQLVVVGKGPERHAL